METQVQKRRIYQVAKEFHISTESLIDYLQKLDFNVRNHMSLVTEEMYDEIRKKFSREIAAEDSSLEFRKRLREKRAIEEARKRKITREILELTHTIPTTVKAEEQKAEAVEEVEEKIEPISEEKKIETVISSVTEEELEVSESAEEGTTKTTEGKVTEEAAKKKKRKRKKKKDQFVAAEKEKPKWKKKIKRRKITTEEVEEAVKKTLAVMEERGKIRKRRKKPQEVGDEIEERRNVIRVNEFISVAELANLMDKEPNDVIKKCLELGTIATINQRLDMDTIVTVADEFGFEVEVLPEYGLDKIEEIEEEDTEGQVEIRPPVVTIMGHVDHGKTSLLDHIRESNIIAGEVGSITQHIGAYEVSVDGKKITFLDTPGHEAFTAMRARGAQVTDIVVLVIASDDRVMPQTIEAIDHAKAAGVPIIVAINKIDKPNADPETIKKQLADHGVLVEEWGGSYPSAEISAKTGQGIDKLLELILIQAEIMELKANPHRPAQGVIIESKLDRGKGPIATTLIQKGTLKIGDSFIAGQHSGRVRVMFDERGKRIDLAPPSTPVQVVGFSGTPQAGDQLIVLRSEKQAKEISLKRQQLKREQDFRMIKPITLDEISRRIKEGEVRELLLIVKGDVDGSVEAISDSLMKLSNEEISVRVIHKGVGTITESDVLLASASHAVIIGFNVNPNAKAKRVAARENVDIRCYSIIYDAISDVKLALEGLLEPEERKELIGTAEVRDIFEIPKVGTIAGSYVASGKVIRNASARLLRDGKPIYEGKISSLKRFKEDVKEVAAGFECGIGLENCDDLSVNDLIEVYDITTVKRTL